ncbi:MAG TPA: amidohydrolase family protein, partial [Burkholderiaceae bacterium]
MKTHHARWLMTDDGWLPDAAVTIDDAGRIASVESNAQHTGSAPDADLLIPSMPNAHCHAFQHRIAGLTERASGAGDSFWTWRERMYEAVAALDPGTLERAATDLYRRMRAQGYGAVAEFHYVHRLGGSAAIETADALVRAARAARVELLLLPVLYRRGGFDDAPLSARQQRFGLTLDAYARLLETLVARLAASPPPPAAAAAPGVSEAAPVRVGIAPHSLRAVSAAELSELLALRASLAPGCPVHIHISEQVAEVQAARERLGTTPIDWLCANAPVDRHWTLVHATHATEAELEQARAREATVCICTTTEANLGDGQFKLAKWWSLGGSISIGSDSNVGIDPREELRWLEYQERLRLRARAVLVTATDPHPGSALWRRAVAGGRRSLGLPAAIATAGAPA